MNQSQLIKLAIDTIIATRRKSAPEYHAYIKYGGSAQMKSAHDNYRDLSLVVDELRELHRISKRVHIKMPPPAPPEQPIRNTIDEINSEIDKLTALVARMADEHQRAVVYGDRMHDRAVKLVGKSTAGVSEFDSELT